MDFVFGLFGGFVLTGMVQQHNFQYDILNKGGGVPIRTSKRTHIVIAPIFKDLKNRTTLTSKPEITELLMALPSIEESQSYIKEMLHITLPSTEKNKYIKLCNYAVNNDYIISQILENDYIFMLFAGKNKHIRGRLRGFALVKEKQNAMLIDVLCAHSGGKALIKAVENFAIHNKKRFLELYALRHVIDYYDHLHFKLIPDNDHYDIEQATTTHTEYKKTKEQNRTKILKLLQNRVNKQKKVGGKLEHPDGCIQQNNTYDMTICSINGFRMIKQLH